HRGKRITSADVVFIRDLISKNPQASRRALSQKLCTAWDWVQPNGHPRDAVCRSLLLALQRASQITLPPPQWAGKGPGRRPRSAVGLSLPFEEAPIRGGLAALGPLTFRQVRRTSEEARFHALLRAHHYLGYSYPVGEHLKLLIYAGARPVACFAWSSAPRHLGPRDRFIGWSPELRRQNIRYVAYNTRFLILPWVEVPHLASHLLGRMVRMLSAEWKRVYQHPVYLAETFVDAPRKGTCYRAANWIPVGQTTGRGKDDLTHRPNRTLKDILVYPLVKDFRARLTSEPGAEADREVEREGRVDVHAE
ncbi:MAG: DUF4338 domain-containing protein, partial [Deltaproteobacteria bacterium]|nr:DUF4338 domain-containing protein [Deltaproteobacteria bacterium]